MYEAKDMDTIQSERVEHARRCLEEAENYVHSFRSAEAKKALNFAAHDIRELERLHKRRRGGPRKELEKTLRYLSSWQQSLIGMTLEELSTVRQRAGLLENAHATTEELLREYPTDQEVLELLKKINKWKAP